MGTTSPSREPASGRGVRAPACAGLVCSFTDATTDPDGNATIRSAEWAAAGSYDVRPVVTDDHGESDDVTHPVQVAQNVPPCRRRDIFFSVSVTPEPALLP